jgi:thiamine-phosphate pyrophosphorylase
VRPLPRVHAYTDADIVAGADFGLKAAAIAAGGPAVALHARIRGDSTAALARLTRRLLALARPPEAAVIVSERTDVAAATGAAGVQLAEDDLSPTDARRILREGWIGRSVHTVAEAAAAVHENSDFLVVGNIFPTDTHPGRPGAGLDLVRGTAALGVPVIAIGGITRERVAAVHAAGAYGVAAIRALWLAPDPAAAVLGLLEPWMETG